MGLDNLKGIHQYIRNSKRQIIGVMIAFKEDDKILIGWSKCNKLDKFNKTRGLEIAIGRAMRGSDTAMPRVVNKAISNFQFRANKYFNNPIRKNWKLIVTPEESAAFTVS